MSPASSDVQAYLDTTYDDWFWRWSDDGSAVTWQDGTTIAFREEIFQVLRHLASRGLPPFDAIVLLLAACRSTWSQCRAQLVHPPQLALDGLDRLAQLPASLREPLACKMILAEQLFESCSSRLHEKMSLKVIDQLNWFEPTQDRVASLGASSGSLWEAVKPLQEGLQNVDEESLRLRIQTGLDQLPESAAVDPLSDSERMNQLLAALLAQGDASGMARLVKQLMAAITVPRPLHHRDDMQLGGVSDLSNRGQLDRLLLSELAHDDLVFSARMALNELLFLQRESPPKDAPEYRQILLDTGLRMWGVPRVFATAVAMALVAAGSRRTTSRVYRASGEQLVRTDLTTVEGLTRHLAALEIDAHPGLALTRFQQTSQDTEGSTLPILVTCPEVAADAEFLAAVQQSQLLPLLIATVDRSGHFRMVSFGLHEHRVLSEADLTLEDLYPDRVEDKRGAINRLRDDCSLPDHILQEPHLLCPPYDLNTAASATVSVDRQAFLIATHDRRVLRFDSTDRHGVQLITSLPLGKVHWISDRTPGSRVTAVVDNMVENQAFLLDIDSAKDSYSLTPLQTVCDEPVLAVAPFQGYLLLIRRTSIDLLDAHGDFMSRAPVPFGFAYSGLHRYFHCDYRDWRCVAVKDRNIVFETLLLSGSVLLDSKILKLMELPSVDGPLALRADGKLVDMSTKQITHRLADLTGSQVVVDVAAQSRDLRRCMVVVEQKPTRDERVVMTKIIEVSAKDDGLAAVVAPGSIQSSLKLNEFPQRSSKDHIRFRFSHVSRVASSDGLPLLILWRGGSGRVLRLASDARGGFMLMLDALKPSRRPHEHRPPLTQNEIDEAGKDRIEFQKIPQPKVGIQLSVATFSTGERLVLDTRGMLHFLPRSFDRLSLSIVLLNEGEIPGRLSDGRWCGAVRFHRDPNPAKWVSSHYIYADFIVPFLEA